MAVSRRRVCGMLVSVAAALGTLGFGWRVVAQTEPEAAPAAVLVEAGRVVFHESGCIYCHQWQGDGGHKGPDLTHVSRRLKAAQIRHQIVAGGGAMPSFEEALTSQQIEAVVLFLSTPEAGKGRKP